MSKHYDEKWKEDISRRTRQLEVIVYIMAAILSIFFGANLFISCSNPLAESRSELKHFLELNLHERVTQIVKNEMLQYEPIPFKEENTQIENKQSKKFSDKTSKKRKTTVGAAHFFEENEKNNEIVRIDYTYPNATAQASYGRALQYQQTSISCDQTLFKLEFLLDNAASEISWNLINQEEDILIAANSYSEKQDLLSPEFEKCLEPGLYIFTLYDSGGNGISCEGESSCYNILVKSEMNDLHMEGKAFIHESTHAFYVSNFGYARERLCHEMPILSPVNVLNNFVHDDRVQKIMDAIQTVSSMVSIGDPGTHQYRAACWILYDDQHDILPESEFLMQRYVMAVFLYATNRNAEQLMPINGCDLKNVTCEQGHITAIEWDNLGLKGYIPSELSHLRYLRKLYLDNNSLTGVFPPQFGRLKNLQELCLRDNKLTGVVPSEIGKLTKLKKLIIDSNYFEGRIPSEIEHCSMLKELHLFDNDISGFIPSELFNCTQLKELSLHQNRLTGSIPTNMENLKKLKSLVLDNNYLSGQIPTQVRHLSSLHELYLYENQLTGSLPEELGYVSTLEKIDVHNNLLSGSLPDIFGNFSKMTQLYLYVNSFSSTIPNSLWNIPAHWLNLRDNGLCGSVPDEFCNRLDSIKLFELDDSSWFLDESKIDCSCCSDANCHLWHSNLPTAGGTVRPTCPGRNIKPIEAFGTLTIYDIIAHVSLTESFGVNRTGSREFCLSPTGCYLKDEIESLQYSSASKKLDSQDGCDTVMVCGEPIDPNHSKRIGLNHLTQLLFPDVSFLSSSTQLLPKYKALCWIINKDPLFHEFEVCDGTLLQRFILTYFYFSLGASDYFDTFSSDPTCQWPDVTCDTTNNKFVENLNVSNHRLRGTLITEIGFLARLHTIDLRENYLIGTINPSIFTNLPYLKVLDIGDNSFEGMIPLDLFILPKIQKISAPNNLFVGSLPDASYSRTLEHINFANNLLTGTIKNALFSCPELKFIDLSQNRIIGKISSNFGNLKEMREIRLYENILSGFIPVELFSLSNLEKLMLQSNQLTCSIPTQVGKLKNASIIALNHNLLKGRIPDELSDLREIERLHLHQNQLTGHAPKMKFQNKSIHNFITDCGTPSFLLISPVTCSSCTMCCNSEKKCQTNTRRWLHVYTLTGFFFVAVPTVSAFLIYVNEKLRNRGFCSFFFEDRDPLSIYNENSIYCFSFSSFWIPWFFHLLIALTQILFFALFLRVSNIDDDDTAWIFTFYCPSNNLNCQDERSIDEFGWILFLVATLLYLGPDFALSSLQIQKAILMQDRQIFFSGFLILGLTTIAVFTSALYNVALAESNSELIVNAVILLFINDLDEKFMKVLTIMFPMWTQKHVAEVKQSMLNKSELVNSLEKCKSVINIQNDTNVGKLEDDTFDYSMSPVDSSSQYSKTTFSTSRAIVEAVPYSKSPLYSSAQNARSTLERHESSLYPDIHFKPTVD